MITFARELVGAWQRKSISLDDRDPSAHVHAILLQATDAFADVRVPDNSERAVEAFAGITTYDDPELTWRRTLDRTGNFTGDHRGVVDRREEKLIVRSEVELDGRVRCYEEIWERIDPGHVGVVLTAPHAVMVRVGNHCIALRDRRRTGRPFDVRRACAVADSWVDVIVLGDGTELAPPPVRLPTFWDVDSEVIIEGAHWRVADRWG
jgi:hypothetical protein